MEYYGFPNAPVTLYINKLYAYVIIQKKRYIDQMFYFYSAGIFHFQDATNISSFYIFWE